MYQIVAKHGATQHSQPQKELRKHHEVSKNQPTIAHLTNMPAGPVSGNYASGFRRMAYLFLAGIFFALGILGIPIPGLPTTPFLLLSSFFLARSWPRLHRSLLNHRVLGPSLLQWQEHHAIDPKIKLRASILVAGSLVLLISYSNLSSALLALVLAFVLTGQYVIYRLPTRKLPNQKPSEVSLEPNRTVSVLSARPQMSR